MKEHLSSIDQILYQELRPWLKANRLEEKYAALLSTVENVEPNLPLNFEVDFERPFNNKTKYYARLIQSASTRTINSILSELKQDLNPQLIKYRLNEILNKKLKTRIKDIGKMIKAQQFDLIYIDPSKTTFDIDQEHKANTYIFQLLKTTLIQIYLEIQYHLKEWIDDSLMITDFYTQLLFEQIPNKTYIKEIQTIEVKPMEDEVDTAQLEKITSLQSFTYKQLNQCPDKLADLCDSLKKIGFIHKETKLPSFKKIFSGQEVSTPVVWTGNVSDFAYFIKQLYTVHQYVDDLKQQQWKVACQCFVRENQVEFESHRLRTLKKPQRTYKQIDLAVNNLK